MRDGVATVLVVEDDQDVREIVAEVLECEGYATERAPNGRSALELLRANGDHPPDAILLDLMMPVMSGWEFRREQLADPELSRIPVVVMSAVASGGVDAAAHLRKPFEMDQLVATLNRVTGRSGRGASPEGAPSPA